MRLVNVTLSGIRKYNRTVSFEFNDSTSINTLSGRNGAGKTTVFSSIMQIQKAYFITRMQHLISETEYERLVTDFGKELYNSSFEKGAYAEVTFEFDNKDRALLPPSISLWDEKFSIYWPINKEGNETFKVTVRLRVDGVSRDTAQWNIFIMDRDDTILGAFWNVETPRNIVAFINSSKNIIEKDVMFDNVKLRPSRKVIDSVSSIVYFAIEPESAFEKLYELMVNDYLYEKINPTNRKGNTPRNDIYYHVTKILFDYLSPHLMLKNLSFIQKEDQFVITAQQKGPNKSKQYDMRGFSAGEKLLWYSLLFINYTKSMGILIIDEPENHLHEELASKLVALLQSLVESEDYKKFVNSLGTESNAKLPTLERELEKEYNFFRLSQVFLLTHSKSLIYQNFTNGSNFVLRDTRAALVDYESCEKVLREIGLSYVNDKVLFVEGKTDVEILEKSVSQYNIQVKTLDNCHEVIRVFQSLQKIKRYLNDPKFIFLIDRDTRSNQEIEVLRNNDQSYFDEHFIVLEKHELENYFLEPSVIRVALKNFEDSNYNAPQKEEIEKIIREEADEQLPHTKRKYMNHVLNNTMGKMNGLIKQSELQVDTKEGHEAYIKDILSTGKIRELEKELIEHFNSMEEKFSSANWDKNWKELMDGKSVYNKVMSKLASGAGVRNDKLKTKMTEILLSSRPTQFKKLIRQLYRMFEIEVATLSDVDLKNGAS
ncbi:DUF4435 domain-containing protein [Paenibacillus sp. EKM202P]|uniref:AAA family ATPase n=1 Tax=Paenibacillus TaxID=44249 RepID=UPI0007EA7B74|nr:MULTISPECIES: AAA family ATPase [Paenibacillus]KAF6563419.1 DUF4435 domain-containing protein [Paenibacillus sp. EKM202P]KAF6569985.1 DUF4435 domain-containing protein [Paenibacillus sp. EKM207P]MDN4081416.1 AAA family ATPase [Paenibacillus polymyxa]MDN4109729.1 AAA family ATPase [Paenibacillus polymyxa]OAZ42739.1 hypothetical protein A9Z39_22570 [Paenibacillus polymyxa]